MPRRNLGKPPIGNLPLADDNVGRPVSATRQAARWMTGIHDQVSDLQTPTAIADADGTLADLTTKFNALLAALRSAGVLPE